MSQSSSERYMRFFNKTRASGIVNARGPTPAEQVSAMAQGTYWTILNTSLLKTATQGGQGVDFLQRINALKHALQTYGPRSPKLPSVLNNQGPRVKGHVFHGHIQSGHTTYVLEWAVVDEVARTMVLTQLGTHENFAFRTKALTRKEKSTLLARPESQKIMQCVAEKVKEATNKVERVSYNYRHQMSNGNGAS